MTRYLIVFTCTLVACSTENLTYMPAQPDLAEWLTLSPPDLSTPPDLDPAALPPDMTSFVDARTVPDLAVQHDLAVAPDLDPVVEVDLKTGASDLWMVAIQEDMAVQSDFTTNSPDLAQSAKPDLKVDSPDLATQPDLKPVLDMVVVVDMTELPDLTTTPDLKTSPDLVPSCGQPHTVCQTATSPCCNDQFGAESCVLDETSLNCCNKRLSGAGGPGCSVWQCGLWHGQMRCLDVSDPSGAAFYVGAQCFGNDGICGNGAQYGKCVNGTCCLMIGGKWTC